MAAITGLSLQSWDQRLPANAAAITGTTDEKSENDTRALGTFFV